MLSDWLAGARPKTFNLDLFFNPQGLLTSMTQEVVRIKKNKNKNKKGAGAGDWSMDAIEMKFNFDKKKDSRESDKKSNQEGIIIEGLSIEGAEIERDGSLKEVDSRHKKLIFDMPLVHATAESRGSGKKGDENRDSVYDCPVYKYPRRTDVYIIFRIPLSSTGNGIGGSHHWRLRGVAILCSTD